MVFSQTKIKGAQSDRTARSKPQRYWNSFALVATIPRKLEGSVFSPTEEIILRCKMTETEKFIQKRKMMGAFSYEQQLPRRRGRTRKNEEVTKALIPEGPRVGMASKRLHRNVTQKQFVGKSR
jgi:hypothetical protein